MRKETRRESSQQGLDSSYIVLRTPDGTRARVTSRHVGSLSGERYISPSSIIPLTTTMSDIILVTGGRGLVGKAIEHIINTEPEGSRFGKKPGETWIFVGSADGDLR